ncbi:hypothetical protein BEP19_13630 [Ammoniphilus oxalaticus]|uniref:Uncharacterized protein n=1 Tax=Ammoniphilus oxalaticus TaxID=66863 RepID=A0A419SEN0_9BACL|nr:hypothetical protein [Ammoniphilus oxalaticus]RKD21674.1 hypothetical protein BEP19_13630 [Ammoniphilus oxalaticus]
MSIQMDQEVTNYFRERIEKAKVTFERAVDCKHTEFDDLYPYMSEHPQFFWYKRYVAWQELLTVSQMAGELGLDWTPQFTAQQVEFVKDKVLEAKVLDNWYPEQDK